MALPDIKDTIIALSTPPGQGAIAVLRLSGPKAIEAVDRVFHGRNLLKVAGNTVHYGKIKDEDDRLLDECLATVFRAPRSYTREDVVEISCHGSPYIVSGITQLFIRLGIRQATPGEFTLRAFLNGQLDLSQAEGVADLIASSSARAHELALKQMRGGLSNEIGQLRQQLIDFASLIELELDFSEEDVEFADRSKLRILVDEIRRVVGALMQSFEWGNAIKLGIPTVIAGRPNAGKSTLLNALLKEERALVSEVAGTTRDSIEAVLNIDGLVFRLIDTAGIRQAQDHVESMGVERTFDKIRDSSIVIYVFDILETDRDKLLEEIESLEKPNAKVLFVANKMDLKPYTKAESYYVDGRIDRKNLIPVSAKNQMNIEFLKEKLLELAIHDNTQASSTIISTDRHYEALRRTDESLQAVLAGMSSGLSSDLIALDIRQALHHLGEITGDISTDDLLDSIFSRFCIGK